MKRTEQQRFAALVRSMQLGISMNPDRIALMRALLDTPEQLIATMGDLATMLVQMTPEERMVFRAAIDAAYASSLNGAATPPSTGAA